jgi:hypothetical protein
MLEKIVRLPLDENAHARRDAGLEDLVEPQSAAE